MAQDGENGSKRFAYSLGWGRAEDTDAGVRALLYHRIPAGRPLALMDAPWGDT